MIITNYLVREIFKNQLVILFILLLVFFCQKLIRILNEVVDGDIPSNLILYLLSLSVPKMKQLILPLSLFLALLMTFSRMYIESEITVMHACGLGKSILIRVTLILSLITGIAATVNVIWLSPWSSRYQNLVITEAKSNISIATLVKGQFKPIENGNLVIFIGNIRNKEFEHIFLASSKLNGNMRLSLVIADHGYLIQNPDGSQLIILNDGIHYEWTAFFRDFLITNFSQYQTVISHHRVAAVKSTSAEQMTFTQLWRSSDPEACAEFHWRLTLVASVIIMAIMAIPLSVVNPRQGRMLNILPAILLYLIFFLLQTSLCSSGAKSKLDPMLWVWFTNIVYLSLALILNLWDSIPARKFRNYLYKNGIN